MLALSHDITAVAVLLQRELFLHLRKRKEKVHIVLESVSCCLFFVLALYSYSYVRKGLSFNIVFFCTKPQWSIVIVSASVAKSSKDVIFIEEKRKIRCQQRHMHS